LADPQGVLERVLIAEKSIPGCGQKLRLSDAASDIATAPHRTSYSVPSGSLPLHVTTTYRTPIGTLTASASPWHTRRVIFDVATSLDHMTIERNIGLTIS